MGVRFSGKVGAALAVGAVLAAGTALAQAPASSGAQAVAARQQNFKQLGRAFKGLMDEMKKPAPDKAVLLQNATRMNELAQQQASWFPKGSGPEAGAKTGVKPIVWTDASGFAAAIQRLQGETAKLQQIAASGDVAAIKVQAQATGGACKNCHEKYRVPDHG